MCAQTLFETIGLRWARPATLCRSARCLFGRLELHELVTSAEQTHAPLMRHAPSTLSVGMPSRPATAASPSGGAVPRWNSTCAATATRFAVRGPSRSPVDFTVKLPAGGGVPLLGEASTLRGEGGSPSLSSRRRDSCRTGGPRPAQPASRIGQLRRSTAAGRQRRARARCRVVRGSGATHGRSAIGSSRQSSRRGAPRQTTSIRRGAARGAHCSRVTLLRDRSQATISHSEASRSEVRPCHPTCGPPLYCRPLWARRSCRTKSTARGAAAAK